MSSLGAPASTTGSPLSLIACEQAHSCECRERFGGRAAIEQGKVTFPCAMAAPSPKLSPNSPWHKSVTGKWALLTGYSLSLSLKFCVFPLIWFSFESETVCLSLYSEAKPRWEFIKLEVVARNTHYKLNRQDINTLGPLLIASNKRGKSSLEYCPSGLSMDLIHR